MPGKLAAGARQAIGEWVTEVVGALRAARGQLATKTPPANQADWLEIPVAFTIEPDSAVAQDGQAGQPVAEKPKVKVKDQKGRKVRNVLVRFAASKGGGYVVGKPQLTNANGKATVPDWILGSEPGENTLIAIAEGVETHPVEFKATVPQP